MKNHNDWNEWNEQPPIDLNAEHEKDMVAWLHSQKEAHLQYDELFWLFLDEIKTGTPTALGIVEELESLLDKLKSDENTTKPYIEAVIALTDEAYQMELELFAQLDAQHDAQQTAEKAAAIRKQYAAAAKAKLEARREKLERRERRDARRADNERREKREKRARRKARHEEREEREARRAENERREQEQAVAHTARSLAAMENEKREREDTESETEETDTGSDKGMCGLHGAPPTHIDHSHTRAYFRSNTSHTNSSSFQPPHSYQQQHPQQWQHSVYDQHSEYYQPSLSSYVRYRTPDQYHQSEYHLSEYHQSEYHPSEYHTSMYRPSKQTVEERVAKFKFIRETSRTSQTITQQQSTAASTTIADESHLTNPAKATTSNQSYPHSNIANPIAAPSILDRRGEVDNMGKAQLVGDTSADTAQAEKEKTVDSDVVLADAEDSAVVDDMTVVKDMTVVDIGSGDTPTHIKTAQTTTIAAPLVAVSLLKVETRGGMIHQVDTVHLTKDGGCNAIDQNTGTTPDDCQVDTTNLTKNVAESFPNDKIRGEMILLDTVLMTKDGGSKVDDYPADCYDELFNLIAKDMRRDGDLYADSHARLQMSELDGDNIDDYIDGPGCTDTTLAYFTDTGASEAGESIDTRLGTTDYFSDFEENSRKESFRQFSINYFPGEFESLKYWHEFDFKCEFEEPQCELGFYMRFSFDNIDPELSLTAPDAFHAYEFDFDPQILTTGPEAFRAYDHSLDETIDYTAHVRSGVT